MHDLLLVKLFDVEY